MDFIFYLVRLIKKILIFNVENLCRKYLMILCLVGCNNLLVIVCLNLLWDMLLRFRNWMLCLIRNFGNLGLFNFIWGMCIKLCLLLRKIYHLWLSFREDVMDSMTLCFLFRRRIHLLMRLRSTLPVRFISIRLDY